jgi:ornithine cyclodeaminase/alanine dehydrogenase
VFGVTAPVFVSAASVAKVLDWRAVVAHVKAVYAAPSQPGAQPPRLVTRGDGARLRTLTAALPSGRLLGAKLMASSRAKRTAYLVALFDQQEGGVVALMDGNAITACRTAATSAAAVDCLVPADRAPLRLGILGSGTEARAHLLAIAALRKPREVLMFSPTPEKRTAFAEEFTRRLGVPCRAVASPGAVVAGSDLLVAAARSRDETPIFRGADLREGMIVISIGSTLPEQREIDPETIARCDLIVADEPEEVSHQTGDCIAARKAGVNFDDKLAPLSDLVTGKLDDRLAASRLTMFKSVGAGIQDIAVAEFVLDRALSMGLATELPLELAIKRGSGEAQWF